MSLVLSNPVIFSCDVSSLKEAELWIERLGPHVGAIKLGPRLLLRASPEWVKAVAKNNIVFADMKFFDIPSTMVAALEAVFELGVSIATVHAMSGIKALQSMAQLEVQFNLTRPFLIAPVTILTSQDQQDLAPNLSDKKITRQIELLSQSVAHCGLQSLICSPHEAAQVRKLGLKPITPGVRLPNQDRQDQSRVMTPVEAMQQGAWGLVIGRPLLQSTDPVLTLSQILASLVPYEKNH